MARKSSKGEGALIAVLLIVGVPIWLVSKVVESAGWITPIVLIVGVIVAVVLYKRKKRNDRVRYLITKYGDQDIVDRIIGGYFWQGQTEEQLIDSIGHPAAKDNKVLKSVVRQVWKYDQRGKNRYGLRVTVENGHVVGWDNKA